MVINPNTSPSPAAVKSLLSPSSLNKLDYHDDDGNDQQEMNESTTSIATNKSQQPQNQENYTYSPKHFRLLSDDKNRPSSSINFEAIKTSSHTFFFVSARGD